MASFFPDMPQPQPRPARSDGGDGGRRVNPFVITVIILAAIVLAVVLASELWTNILWFRQLEFQNVLFTRWLTQAALFALHAVVTGGLLWASLFLAWRGRPLYPPITREQEVAEQFRRSIEPLRKVLTIGIPVLVGLMAGLAGVQNWQTVQLFFNGGDFGTTDPLFGRDVSFFVFALPFIDILVSLFQSALFIALLGGAVVHYLYGGIVIGARGAGNVSKLARRQLGFLGAGLAIALGASFWFGRYDVVNATNLQFDGAAYADVHATLPAQQILAIIAVVVAAMFVLWALRGDWRIPALGVGLMLVSSIVVGNIYPALVQQFRVEPNEQALETPYIQDNIDATRAAYGIDDVEVVEYDATTDAEPGALREDAETTAQIRLLDPDVVTPAFAQLQQNKQYYTFMAPLAVDRYRFDEETHDTVIGVRELDLAGVQDSQRNWVNDHTVYTHGYGVVAAYGNQRAASGAPDFFQRGIPSEGPLDDYEERIYFGQNSPEYSVVGASTPEDEGQELDYSTTDGTDVMTTYKGDGGPSVGNFLNQLLYSVKFRDVNILISELVNDQSQILYDREPRERVRAVAPFLTVDSNTYPAVVDDEVVWVVDAYTTSNAYPYSQYESLAGATSDSLQSQAQAEQFQGRDINYMRNSVKATVNAYDGSVTLYAWNTDDPMLQAWQEVFPEQFTPRSEISSELMGHLRYPEDQFKVQRSILERYHVTEASQFFSGQDFWRVPDDPTVDASSANGGGEQQANLPGQQQTSGAGVLQPPHYLTLQPPTRESPRFTISTPYIPTDSGSGQERSILTGMLIGDSETGTEAGAPAESYGSLTLLELPKDLTVNGPGQVQNQFSSTPEVSESLNLLSQGNSEVISGNLLTLPVGGGLLYVQPVYVQSSGSTSYPLLQMVLVSFGDSIGFAPTLDEALDQVFGGDSGADAGDAEVDAGGEAGAVDTDTGEATTEPTDNATSAPATEAPATQEPESGETAPPASGGAGDAQATLDQALADADQAVVDAQAALESGDWAAYGEATDRLADAVQRANDANAQLEGQGG